MAHITASIFTEFVFATGKDGQPVEIFKREAAPDTDTIIHRTVDTIIDLGVKDDAAANVARSRLLVSSFNHVGKKKTAEIYVREKPEELNQILSKVQVEPEMWDGFRKKVDTLVARLTGRRQRGAEAHI